MSLCPHLRPVYEYEVARGNTIAQSTAPAGAACESEVVFSEPLKIWGTPAAEALPPVVKPWENRDTHYPLEAGFFCTEHRHSVAGPVAR